MSMSMRKKRAIGSLVTYLMVIAAYLVCQYLLATGGMTRSLRGQLVPICVWVVMAVSLNLVVGVSGELSLGHAGFMSVGAFPASWPPAGCWAPFSLKTRSCASCCR